MALYVKTKNADDLKKRIYESIHNKEIDTWKIDQENDFIYVPPQWTGEAWIRCIEPVDQELKFGIVSRKDKTLSKLVYGIYLGRFAEMLTVHFDTYFERIEITAELIEGIDLY